MSDNLETQWAAEPHTLAKHEILSAYLNAWMPIMVRQSAKVGSVHGREVLYVDGFAGPGKYTGGEDGSPIIAMKAAMSHQAEFPVPIRFLFIELDPDRCALLRQCVNEQKNRLQGAFKIRVDEPIQDDCNKVLSGILEKYKRSGTKFGPALVFLDQFGYSAVPMTLVAEIMRFPSCEVFSYLEFGYLNRFITDETKWPGIDSAFGGTEWREVINLPAGERAKALLDRYKDALQTKGNVNYVSNFSMHDSKGQLIYWLFFCTNSLRGLEEMKKAMWKVDQSGTFRFSDAANPGQESLFLNCGYTDEWIATEMSKRFAGQTIKGSRFMEEVLVNTPCVHYKGAFQILWRGKQIRCPGVTGRAPAFADSLQIEFLESSHGKKKNEDQGHLF